MKRELWKLCTKLLCHVFVTTKLAAEIKSYDAAMQAINQSLKDLDYVDLMLIHSPQPWA